ncbi:MAG: hypothetical protein AAB368_08000, partial [bacterium]
MARDPLDDLLDAQDPLDELLADAAAPRAPVRADFQWTTELPYENRAGAMEVVPPRPQGPPGIIPEQRFRPGLDDLNRDPLGPPTPEMRPAAIPPPVGRMSPQRFGKLSGQELPEQPRALELAEPVLRPLIGAGAGALQLASDVVQFLGATAGAKADSPLGQATGATGKRPALFNSKTYFRDLEASGFYGEANFWDRVSQKAGEIAAPLATMNAITGGLTKAGVMPFIAQQAGMGVVGLTQATAQAAREGRNLSGDEMLGMAVSNTVEYPLYALGIGAAAKELLKGTKYAAALTPAVSAALTGAAFEGMPEPGPGESRLENALAGAATFGLDAAVRHNFPGMTRSFRERGAKRQTGFAAEALEASADGAGVAPKRTAAEDAALATKMAQSRAEEFTRNFVAKSRLAGLDPAAKGQATSLSPEMVVAESGVDIAQARALVAKHLRAKTEDTRAIQKQMVNEKIVENALQAGGQKAADEMRYRLGPPMMDPFEARRYKTDVVGGENVSEVGYKPVATPTDIGALRKQARADLKAEFLDQFMAQRTGDLENARLRAGTEAERARVQGFERERQADSDVAAMEGELAPPPAPVAPTQAELRAQAAGAEIGPKFTQFSPPPPQRRAEPQVRQAAEPVAAEAPPVVQRGYERAPRPPIQAPKPKAPPVKAAAPPEPPKAPPVAEQPPPEAPPVEKQPRVPKP